LADAIKYADEQNIEELIHQETEFHNILYKATKSKKVYSILLTLHDQLRIYRAIASRTKGGAKASVWEHTKILEAIERKNEARAKCLMRKHIDHAKRRALKNELFVE
jgi:DNA-binding GntR family transcriptional regulator